MSELASFDIGLLGACLVAATPVGPVQHVLGGRWGVPDEREEQPPHFGHCQRRELGELGGCQTRARACPFPDCFLLARPPLRPCGPWRACQRTTVR